METPRLFIVPEHESCTWAVRMLLTRVCVLQCTVCYDVMIVDTDIRVIRELVEGR